MVPPTALKSLNPRPRRRPAVSAKNAKRTVFLFYSIFGCALLVTCALTNIILLLVVHGSVTVAESVNRQQDALPTPTDPEMILATRYLFFTWMINFFAAIVTVPCLYSALEVLSRMMAKRRVFSQEAPLTGFLIRHSLLHILLVLSAVGLICVACYAAVIRTPDLVSTFAFSLFLYTCGVHVAAVLFVKEIFQLVNFHMIKRQSSPLLRVVVTPDIINV